MIGALLVEGARRQNLGDVALLSTAVRLLLLLAGINAVVTLLVNPWRHDKASERFPAIVQDVAVFAIFAAVATAFFREQLLITSTIGAAVLGFSLQDTLGNLFAGLAIQIEQPFRVGHWISIADKEGQVQEVTWRATKLRTKNGQFLIVPNNVVSQQPVLNYSEPTIPTRVDVEVGASYLTPPNDVKDAIGEAIRNAPLAMTAPPPEVTVKDFGGSSVDYLAQFWIEDYAVDRRARDQVRTNIWYEFRRRNIEIPWPIQVQYERDEEPVRTDRHIDQAASELGRVDLFATLTPEARTVLAASSNEQLFAAGEAIVRQGATGDSMFIVLSGRVRVTLEPSGQEVATTAAGGFFGEMSMLTGEPRTATVRAVVDSRVLQITSGAFSELALATPSLLEHVTTVVTNRRAGLDAARAAAASHTTETKAGFLERMRKYLRV